MLTILSQEKEVRRAQKLFIDRMNEAAAKTGKINIGWQGGNDVRKVSWSSGLSIWWMLSNEIQNRYWNAFGTETPQWDSRHSHIIDCEINIGYGGVNRRISGAFARNEEGRLFLVHRGRIGGGRKGIGKSRFEENFQGEWEPVSQGELTENFALVGALESKRFQKQVADFVKEVNRIKSLPTKYRKLSAIKSGFTPEFQGIKEYSMSKNIAAKCDHGPIVGALREKLESQGIIVGNRGLMDLYVLDKTQKIHTLFEVKTDSTPTRCYEAIGQLFYYSLYY